MLVSCVCPTTERRRQWLPLAIRDFLAQTYDARELLIVVDPGYVPEVPGDLRIRVVEAPAGMKLGAKRNFACSQAAGELIAHFDDDDHSTAERLEDQVSRICETGKALTGYSRMKFTDGAGWWRYRDAAYPLGSSLCFRREWWERNQFPDMAVGSDHPFIAGARTKGQAVVVDCDERMFARMHADSTNRGRKMSNDCWEVCEPWQQREVYA